MKFSHEINRQGTVGRWTSFSAAILGVTLGGTYLFGWTKGFISRFK